MRTEVVEQAALASVGKDFVVDLSEQRGGQGLDLKAGLVMDAVRAREIRALLLMEAISQKSSPFGKILPCRRGHFRQENIGIFPGDDVACTGDAHRQAEVGVYDGTLRQDIEKFGVQGSAVHLEDQVSHRRSQDRKNHATAARHDCSAASP